MCLGSSVILNLKRVELMLERLFLLFQKFMQPAGDLALTVSFMFHFSCVHDDALKLSFADFKRSQ